MRTANYALTLVLASLAFACSVPSTDSSATGKAADKPAAPAAPEPVDTFEVDPAFAKLVPEREPEPVDPLARPRPTGWIQAAVPEVEGPHSLDEVRKLVAAKSYELLGCYEAALPRIPELHGDLVIHFVIEPDGKVSEHEAIGVEEFGGPRAAACMLRGVSRWTWGPGQIGLVTTVDYRFRFGTE